jgi:peptidoglycan/xylan/chitin deacetylase (PgdA/CDA1 family)
MREKNKKTIIQAGIVIVALLIGGIIGATAQSNLFSGTAEPQETAESSKTSVAIVSSVVPASRQTVRPDNALPSAEATKLLSEPTTTAGEQVSTATSADASATEIEEMEATDEAEPVETADAAQKSTATASLTATRTSASQPTEHSEASPSPSAEPASENSSSYGKPITRVSYSLDEVESYSSYRVKEGDTIASISERGGTTPELLMQYNRLDGEAQPGRELIIPQLEGYTNELPEDELVVVAGNTQKPWVALTIDCGMMNEHTAAILDILDEADASATFFMHGDVIGDDPSLLQRMVDDGHELGSHSYDHPDFTTLTDEEIVDQLLRTEEILQEVVGDEIPIRPYFRFPFGTFDDRTRQVVIETGYLPISWTIDNYGTDWYHQEEVPTDMVERLKISPEPELTGGIILSHCMAETVEELPEMIDVVYERGYEFRTLTEVLGP